MDIEDAPVKPVDSVSMRKDPGTRKMQMQLNAAASMVATEIEAREKEVVAREEVEAQLRQAQKQIALHAAQNMRRASSRTDPAQQLNDMQQQHDEHTRPSSLF